MTVPQRHKANHVSWRCSNVVWAVTQCRLELLTVNYHHNANKERKERLVGRGAVFYSASCPAGKRGKLWGIKDFCI